ncbi:hypothetical protein P9139_00485 [Curtobacterium flaccumfaciens]|nr:hypothetical protein P9139_00485 [Curtobacterium flaccumfaciens]
MSTVDPAGERQIREASYRGSTTALIWTVIGAVLLVAAGCVAGLGASQFVNVFRMMNLNSVFSDSADPQVVWWTIPAAVVGSLIAGAVYTRWNHRWSGRTSDFSGVGPATPWLIGATASLWWATTALWPAPDQVGVAVDPTFGQDETWGVGEWIWYAARWWLPAIASIFSLLALIGGAIARRRRGNRRVLIGELLRAGRRTEGEVTAVSGTTSPEATYTMLSWTFAFTDLHGTRRWVERTEGFRDGTAPVHGAPVSVLFDPARPEDTRRIFAAPRGGDDVDDYLRLGS